MDNGLASCGKVANVADMAAPKDLVKQVTEGKEELDALYDMQGQTHGWVRRIAGVQRKHGQRLDSIEGILVDHDGKLDRIELAIELAQGEHTAKLDEILGILKAP